MLPKEMSNSQPQKANPLKVNDELFAVARSVRYHAKREAFFQTLDQWSKIISVTLSLGVVGDLLNGSPKFSLWLAAGVAAVGVIDLVKGFGAMSKRHLELGQQFISLNQDYVRLGDDITEMQFRDLCARRLEIEKREPPILKTLNRICHNEECHVRKRDEYGYPLKWYVRRSAHFCNWFFNEEAKTRKQLKELNANPA